VISSSKNADLDKATCDLMLKRARFIPATDAAGKHVAGTFRSSVRWQIPDGAPPLPAPSQFLVAYDVLPNGTVANCTVTVTGAVLTKVPENPQTLCVNLGPFAPPVDAHGKRIKKHVSAQNSTTVTDVP
jgi:hypothetical protein